MAPVQPQSRAEPEHILVAVCIAEAPDGPCLKTGLIRTILEQTIISQATSPFISLIVATAGCKVLSPSGAADVA